VDRAFLLLAIIVILGLLFEFANGFHDAANAIATIVGTRVLSPFAAVMMAGAFNFVGAISGTAVATTVGKGIVDPLAITQVTVIAALLSAIIWDVITWYFGLPSSSSHALIFSVVGAGVATSGFGAVLVPGLSRTGLGIIYSPLAGFVCAALVLVGLMHLFRRAERLTANTLFARLQLVSSAYMAYSHGGNDGQKTMGIIALALFTNGALGAEFYIPTWVIVAAGLSISLGTAAGGWRIVKTMGFGLGELRPIHGFVAETTAGTVIEVATRFGVPISTTHAITGAILGVGTVRHAKGVRWGIARRIVIGWVLTIPGCFLLGYAIKSVLGVLPDPLG
jgi:PiT family inorganic phosphate transporter